MPSAPQIDAPVSLSNFFPDDSSSCDENDEGTRGSKVNDNSKEFDQCYETQSVDLCGVRLFVRQFAYHSHNANRVWPGTFNLAEYLLQDGIGNDVEEGSERNILPNPEPLGLSPSTSFQARRNWGSVLELGSATGLLAIRLAMSSLQALPKFDQGLKCLEVTTSDVDDEYGEVAENVKHNFLLNGFRENDSDKATLEQTGNEIIKECKEKRGTAVDENNCLRQPAIAPDAVIPLHIPHTWGSGWKSSISKAFSGLSEKEVVALQSKVFDTIVASDILLYVSAYEALVKTLVEIIPPLRPDEGDKNRKKQVFIMSWNRRMEGSNKFFELMDDAGFDCSHEGKCVYKFTRRQCNS